MSDNPYQAPDKYEAAKIDIATGPRRSPVAKLIVLIVVVAAAAAGFYYFGDVLALERLAAQETQLREFQQFHPILVLGAAFLLYVLVTGLSLPGALALTLVFGWYLGFWQAVILISFASTLGATIAFLLSRYLLRDTIQSKFEQRLKAFNENLENEGAFYLFTLRMIPVVPFFIINVVMGLTPMKTWTFWWVSQIGMLAGTVVYVWAGSTVPSLSVLADQGIGGILSWEIIVAFTLLGIFPFAATKIIGVFRPKSDRRQSDSSANWNEPKSIL